MVLQEQLALHPKTGLLTNYLVLNDKGKYVPSIGKTEGMGHGELYGQVSCKSPWHLSHYYSLTGDARVRPLMEAQVQFFTKELSHGGIAINYGLQGYRTCKSSYQKNYAAPVRLLFGTLGWNDCYHVMVDKTKDAESWNDSTGYTIDLLCTPQYNGKADVSLHNIGS